VTLLLAGRILFLVSPATTLWGARYHLIDWGRDAILAPFGVPMALISLSAGGRTLDQAPGPPEA
jgi:hypothetical protein